MDRQCLALNLWAIVLASFSSSALAGDAVPLPPPPLAPLPRQSTSGYAPYLEVGIAGETGSNEDRGASQAGTPLQEDVPQIEAATDKSEPPGPVALGKDAGKKPPSAAEKRKALAKAVAGSHKGVFWNNNFDHVCDPCYDECHLGDALKRRCLGPVGCNGGMVLDIGGSYRLRFHDESNMRGLGLTGNDDDFLLHQTRLYGNLEISSRVRIYAEMIDAVSNYESRSPRPIEEDRADLLNLFGDFLLLDGPRIDTSFRIGRQELIYGNQRLVSPLGWANTRRTFQGGKLDFKGKKWDVQTFWTNPMPTTTLRFNSPDQSREFSGVYAAGKPAENQTVDLFYLRFIETDGAGFQYNTFGGRYQGKHDAWLWEGFVAGQFGEVAAASQGAWAYTLGLGRNLDPLPWSPTLWAYFDFATGAANGNGFHHLFPLAHKYLGFMDLFGRRNIEDVNFLLTAKPTAKLKLLLWWHIFHLQNGNDVPYNVNMTPFAGATPGGSSSLGQELDLLASYNLTPYTNVVFGYSHFFTGDWYRTNPTPPPSTGDADFFYVQFTQNF